MTNPLPPLGLDDIRAAGPDRDNAEAFDPRETWCLACEKLGEGYPAADVAALLLSLEPAEIDAVAEDWKASTLETLASPATEGRDFHCPDLRLCLALQEIDPDRDAWGCAPTLDPWSLWEAVQEVADLRAQVAAIPAEAIASALKWAEAFHEQGRDDDTSAEEQAERDQGEDALDEARAWLGTLKQ